MYKVVEKKKHAELHINYKNEIMIAVVDLHRLQEVKQYNWNIWLKNNKWGVYYYVATRLCKKKKYKTFYLHQLIAGKAKGNNVVDHISRDAMDNRESNLRIVGRRENAWNSTKLVFGRYKPSPII
jgi:hypothetical protein